MIPEGQLEVWSGKGATATAVATHTSIRTALSTHLGLPVGSYDVFLQGSYKNDTNIRGDSDVDVVVQYNETWGRDLSALPQLGQTRYAAAYEASEYEWRDFRSAVLRALQQYYAVHAVDATGNKSLKLRRTQGRLAADIVPAFHYRDYIHFNTVEDQSFYDGIRFHHRLDNRPIINYPKLHYAHGIIKNGSTEGNYKRAVRMFKNARSYLLDHGSLPDGTAPSYFLECFIYNVPDPLFRGSLQSIFSNAWEYLDQSDWDSCQCQNERLSLFGDSREQWDAGNARQLLSALADLWNDWYE